MNRKLRDWLKKQFFKIYKLTLRAGLHVIPDHYYSSQPNILVLEKTLNIWTNPSLMPGIHVDLDQQVKNLQAVCLPYQKEYLGNSTYQVAVEKKYGPGYGFIEAQALHALIRYYRPYRIVEIGGGISTYCSYAALKINKDEYKKSFYITCIEPNPSLPLKNFSRRVSNFQLINKPVQEVPLDFFNVLSEGDVFFIDSSHAVKVGSDVNYIILEILPRLKKGVLVHFHDIYFPFDYQRDVLRTFLHSSESSLLRAFLVFNTRFEILFCLSHLHYERPEALKRIFPDYSPQSETKGLLDSNYNPDRHFPSSIWLRICN